MFILGKLSEVAETAVDDITITSDELVHMSSPSCGPP
jgi:hypothetical protein